MDAADLRLGSRTARGRCIGKTIRARIADAPQLWVLAALCGSLVCLQQFHPLAFRAPTLRAIIETEITLSALAAACLFAQSFGHLRRVRDLLFVAALVQVALIDLVSYVIPAAVSLHPVGLLTGAPMLGKLFMAVTVAAAVIAPASAETARTSKPLALAIGGGVLCAAVAELGGLLLPSGASLVPGGPVPHGISAALSHPFGFWTSLIAATLLIVAAVRLVREDCSGAASVTMLLAAGIVVFVAARLDSLVLPRAGIGWVTPREALLRCRLRAAPRCGAATGGGGPAGDRSHGGCRGASSHRPRSS